MRPEDSSILQKEDSVPVKVARVSVLARRDHERFTKERMLPTPCVSFGEDPSNFSSAMPTMVCAVLVAFIPAPGVLESVMRSPFAMSPPSSVTRTGTRPESATGVLLATSCPKRSPGAVEMIPSGMLPATARATCPGRASSAISTATISPGARVGSFVG